jgi:hypothetical protein
VYHGYGRDGTSAMDIGQIDSLAVTSAARANASLSCKSLITASQRLKENVSLDSISVGNENGYRAKGEYMSIRKPRMIFRVGDIVFEHARSLYLYG